MKIESEIIPEEQVPVIQLEPGTLVQFRNLQDTVYMITGIAQVENTPMSSDVYVDVMIVYSEDKHLAGQTRRINATAGLEIFYGKLTIKQSR